MELALYKTNRINDITTIYNINYKNVTLYYSNLINGILRSSRPNKINLINNITSVCNSNLNDLKKKESMNFFNKNIYVLSSHCYYE